jgi:hypothetical protein
MRRADCELKMAEGQAVVVGWRADKRVHRHERSCRKSQTCSRWYYTPNCPRYGAYADTGVRNARLQCVEISTASFTT